MISNNLWSLKGSCLISCLWFLGPYTTSAIAVTIVYMIIFAWRCFIISKTMETPALYFNNKAVLAKISRKMANLGYFQWFLGPYTTFPTAVIAIYIIIFAWICFIINKTRGKPVLHFCNKSVLAKISRKCPIWAIFSSFRDFLALILPPLWQLQPYIW